MKTGIKKALLVAATAGTLGGCASYSGERPKLTYFIVPCSTPGAFPAQPVNTADGNPTDGPQDLLPQTMGAAPNDATKEPTTCLIAAANARPWGTAYSGYGYAPYYPYPRHYGSGIGVVFHGGGHRGGHHGGGHRRH